MLKWLRKHDVGMRVLSLVGAIVLWFFVIQVIDPDGQQRTVTLPVRLLNESGLAESERVMTSEKVLTARVTFVGKYGMVNTVADSPDEYGVLELDLSGIHGVFDSRAKPRWRWYDGRPSGITGAEVSTTVHVRLERVVDVLVPVEIELTGRAPANYRVTPQAPDPAYVTVTGPESMVGVAKAIALFDVSDVRDTVSTQTGLVFYDAEDTPVELNYDYVTVDVQTVRIQLAVRRDKTVNLKVERYVNYPEFLAKDALVTHIDPGSVSVTGEPGVVEGVHSITLSEIDIMAFLSSAEDYARGYVSREIEVPNGVISDANGTMAAVYIAFPGYVRQQMSVDAADLPAHPRFELAEQTLSLTLFGLGDDPEAALAAPGDLTLDFRQDIDTLSPGEHEVDVTIGCRNSGVHVLGEHRITIIVPQPEEPDDPFDTQGEGD